MKALLANILLLIACQTPVIAQYTYVGNSSDLGNNCYEITPAQNWQNGAIWYNEIINLNVAFHLQFEAGFGSNPGGADGIVFVMQQVGNDVLGINGGGMGFSGFQPSFGIEFDTFQNADLGDPTFDHLAFLRNGNVNHNLPNNLAGPVQTSSTSPNIKDGMNHTVDIFWNPETLSIIVWFDCVPRLTANYDLIQNVFNGNPNVYWGFTGATGGLSNQHKVCLDPSILGLPATYEMCNGEEVELQASGTSSGTYSWEPAALVSNPNINNPTTSVTENTEFTVTFTDLCGTEQTQSTQVIVNNPMAVLGPDIEACDGETVNIEPIESNGSLLWSTGSTATSIGVTQSGTYTLTATDGSCSATDEILVSFTQEVELNMPASAAICEGESFEVDLSTAGLEITWSDGLSGAIREFTEQGTYTATGSAGACTAEASIEITVNPIPEFSLGPDLELCGDESIDLTANVDNASIVTWNTGQSGATIEVNQSGYYEATASANGCSFSDGTDVLLLESPEVSIVGELIFCTGLSTALTAHGAAQYIWSNGNTGSEITTSQSGGINVTGIADNGCEATASALLQVRPLPSIVMPENVEKCIGRSILIVAEVQHAQTTSWDVGGSGLQLEVSDPGKYTLTATNACGDRHASIEVTDRECVQNLWVPNTFSPNGDGINDLFKAEGEGFLRFRMQIFDRLGQMVFEGHSIDDAWNGSYQNGGYFCEAGVYAVRITGEYDNLDLVERIGHVLLLR